MSRAHIAAFVIGALAACSPKAEAPAPPAETPAPDWTLSAKTIGSIPFGQTVAEFAKAQGTTADTTVDAVECEYWWPAGGPKGLSLMVDSGKVVRADIDSVGPKTAKGIGIGSTIAEVQAAYPGAVAEPHKYNYDQGWRVFTALESDSSGAIVFEVDSTSVRQIHAGRLPHARWVERCS